MAVFIFIAAWTSIVKKNICRIPGIAKRNMLCYEAVQTTHYFATSTNLLFEFNEVIFCVFWTCIQFNGVQHKLSDFIVKLHIVNSNMGHLKCLPIRLCNTFNIQPATHQMWTLFIKILTGLSLKFLMQMKCTYCSSSYDWIWQNLRHTHTHTHRHNGYCNKYRALNFGKLAKERTT